MKKAPNSGSRYLKAVSETPSSSAAKNGPRMLPSPPTDDDDQEIDEMLERIAGIDRQDLGAERRRPARRARCPARRSR